MRVNFRSTIYVITFTINTLTATPKSYISLGTPRPLMLSVVMGDQICSNIFFIDVLLKFLIV